MNVVKDRLTYQQIHVVWPYGSIRLQQLDMLQEWGEHARISVQGSIDPMLAESLLKEASADDNIELWYDDEQDTRRPLFMGQLYDVQVLHAPEEATVQLEIISHSFKLDTEFKNRSFQRVDQQFVEIVDAVLADYPGADKIDEAFGKQATGQFILQYQETDWVFLQRLASHAGATLIPNTLSHRPQIWIGVPQTGKQIRLEGVPFTLQRNLAPYLDQVTNRGASVRAEDYTRYAFEWDRILQLGDEVQRGHEVYVITRREGKLVRGLMTWSYECAIPEGLRVPKRYNQTIIGASIEGKIIEVSRNQVRLHLDLDKQPPQAAQWFPYSAEGNQVWYLMPEKGAQVKLYFPGQDEDDAMVIQSVRTKPSTNVPRASSASSAAPGAIVESPAQRHARKTADPGVKSFANPEGKEISLGQQELAMHAQEGALYINMNAHYGVSLNSTQRVQIQASGGLSLSGGRIQFVGSDGLHLGTTTEKLDLAEQVNSQGTEVQLEASVHQSYGEPLLSAFEQQVAEQGIGMVMASRGLDNALEEGKGALDAGIEFVEGIWNMAVDVLDVGAQVLNMDESDFNHGRLGPGFLEHNETQEGLRRAMDATGNYIADTVMLKKSWSELGNDIKGAGESLIDPFVKVSEDEGNWLTRSTEESYNAGYNQVKAAERAVDIIAFGKGAAKLGKSIGDMSKRPSSVHGESAGGRSAHGDGNSGGRPVVTPQWKYNLHEKAKSLGGDGKFKTNALRLPLDIASLEEFMQSLANRMNIFSKRLIPVGFGKISNGRPRWEFEDYSRMDSNGRGGSGGGPDKPPRDHHEDERKRREDEEQQRKDEEAEGAGNLFNTLETLGLNTPQDIFRAKKLQAVGVTEENIIKVIQNGMNSSAFIQKKILNLDEFKYLNADQRNAVISAINDGRVDISKWTGKVAGELDGLTREEWLAIDKYMGNGKNIYRIPENAKEKVADFVVDEVKVEFKGLLTDTLEGIESKAFKYARESFTPLPAGKNADSLVLDVSSNGQNITLEQASSIANKIKEKYPNKTIEIWTSDGDVIK